MGVTPSHKRRENRRLKAAVTRCAVAGIVGVVNGVREAASLLRLNRGRLQLQLYFWGCRRATCRGDRTTSDRLNRCVELKVQLAVWRRC